MSPALETPRRVPEILHLAAVSDIGLHKLDALLRTRSAFGNQVGFVLQAFVETSARHHDAISGRCQTLRELLPDSRRCTDNDDDFAVARHVSLKLARSKSEKKGGI